MLVRICLEFMRRIVDWGVESIWRPIRHTILRLLGAAPPQRYNPSPRFEALPSPFTGGLVFARESADRKDDVLYADFSYFDGLHWVMLGRHDGMPTDSDEKTGQWGVAWDVSHLAAGTYRLRVEMTDMSRLGYGSDSVEVEVAHQPRGSVAISSVDRDSVTFSAAEMADPDNGTLQFSWRFDDGRSFTGPTVRLTDYAEHLPIIFSFRTMNSRGAALDNVFLFIDGLLLSLVDHQVGITLGNWITALKDIATEKEGLKARLTDENRARIDRAVKKLRQAAEQVDDAKKKLEAKPPDEAGAKASLEAARRLVREAIDELNAITQERAAIDANVAKLRGVMTASAVSLLEADYLIDHLNALGDIIAEKRKLSGLPKEAQDALDEALRLLDEAKALLDSAKAALLATPPDIGAALSKVDAARLKVREAGKKLEAVKPQPPGFADNIEKLKRLYLELSFLAGKLWLLGQIGLDNPHADIPFPKLTRDHTPQTRDLAGEIEMGPDKVDDNGWELDVTYHELDHWFLFKKNGRVLPGGDHWYDEDLAKARGEKRGRELAWSEGWANFSSCAKRKDFHYLDEGEDGQKKDAHFTMEKDLEHDQCKNTGDASMHPNANKGPAVEGSVSGILWDIFDGDCNGVPDLDADGVCVPFKWIWQTINEMAEDNIFEFYKSLRKVLDREHVPYDPAKLDKIFTEHGVTPPP